MRRNARHNALLIPKRPNWRISTRRLALHSRAATRYLCRKTPHSQVASQTPLNKWMLYSMSICKLTIAAPSHYYNLKYLLSSTTRLFVNIKGHFIHILSLGAPIVLTSDSFKVV